MTIVVVCEFCRKRYRFRDELVGTTAMCEVCGDLITIRPAGAADAPPANPPVRVPISFEGPARSPLVQAGAPPAEQRCAACSASAASEAAFCLYCGYDLRIGWRPPDGRWLIGEQDVAPDPRRPGVSDSIYKVSWGLQLVLWDVALTALINVSLLIGPYLLIGMVDLVTMFRILAAMQLLWIVVMGLGMTGRMLCLLVPDESQAKPIIFASVALEMYAMLVNGVDFFLVAGVAPQALAVGKVASLVAHVLFLAFLARLANYLRRGDLAMEATKSLVVGSVFVVAAILAVLAKFFFPLGTVLFAVGSLLLLPFLVFPYLLLLQGFHRALRHLA